MPSIQVILMFILIYVSLFCSILFIITFFSAGILKRIPLKKFPKVSILIAAYNEAECIAETIKNALNIDYPNFEVIVIENGGSTDGTYEIAKKFVKEGAKVFSIKKGGKGRALNYGIKIATGEIMITMDADTVADRNVLRGLVPYFANPQVMSVSPSIKPKGNKTILQKLQFVEYLFGIFYRRVFSILNALYVVPGAFTAYRKEFFEKHGGFDTDNITEDLEMTLRTHFLKYKVKNVMDVFVYTKTPETFGDLNKQRIRWFLGMLENFIKYRKLFSIKYGFLGAVILPAITFSLFLVLTLFIFIIISLIGKAITWLPYLANSQLPSLLQIKSMFRFDWFYISISPEFFLGIVLILLSSLVVIAIKRFAKGEYSIGPTFIIYLLTYTYLFVYWWFVTLAYKVAGRNVRFGGVVWNKSLVNMLSDRIKRITVH